jgi:hypothetical protein
MMVEDHLRAVEEAATLYDRLRLFTITACGLNLSLASSWHQILFRVLARGA